MFLHVESDSPWWSWSPPIIWGASLRLGKEKLDLAHSTLWRSTHDQPHYRHIVGRPRASSDPTEMEVRASRRRVTATMGMPPSARDQVYRQPTTRALSAWRESCDAECLLTCDQGASPPTTDLLRLGQEWWELKEKFACDQDPLVSICSGNVFFFLWWIETLE